MAVNPQNYNPPYFVFDMFGRYTETVDVELERSTLVPPPEEDSIYNWNGVEWKHAPIIVEQPTLPEVVSVINYGTRMSVGAFFDRFGDSKIPILSSQDFTIKAIIHDASVRAYIDISHEKVLECIQVIKEIGGYDIDPVAIVSAPVQEFELVGH